METNSAGTGFRIWGADNVVHGPLELPTLVNQVKAGGVTANTWVYSEKDDHWRKAPQVPELRMLFQAPPGSGAVPKATADVSSDTAVYACQPASLRRVKIFNAFNDAQLMRFVNFMEVQRARQGTEIVKQGQHGDALYLVLEGELRVRMMVAGKETILVTLNPGDFFGEISLFDHGPRSADVVANQTSLLLKISAAAFENLLSAAPDLAAPFLFAMGKTLTDRVRADNKRYRDSINFARTAGK